MSDAAKKYTKTNTGFLMVLRQGDSLFNELESLAKKENIQSASFTGFGFLGNVQFGFFNKETKQYEPKDFTDVELVSMTGSIAWEGNKPSLHLHGAVGDKNMDAFAGHMLRATVGNGSLEIFIVTYNKKLERKDDPAIGAKVLQVNQD